jgi:hypothetical protein
MLFKITEVGTAKMGETEKIGTGTHIWRERRAENEAQLIN